ncbi:MULTISPECIES: glycosyltransferase [unclassified Streptomyces]|uniref:glycosyltransferase n=1 Tax=unclassified Streptomyces TaxID=2593676 RepID=UPI002E2AE96D|nr:glycosyltransferase [Streptomyces sp. NBC_00223]
MRFLFVSGGSAGAVFPITPLALAARNAGHQVLVGATENVMPLVAASALPGVPLTPRTMFDFMQRDRHGTAMEIPKDPHERNLFNGRGMARLAVGSLEGLVPLIERWRPDVIVGGALSYAAPLVAHRFGIPWARHALNMGEPAVIDLSAAAELAPELENLGLSELPGPDMFIDICPPSVRRPDAPDAQFMRYVPFNTHRATEPWMYTRSGDRPRVCVSAGSRVTADYEFDALKALVRKVAAFDVELLVAAPQDMADALKDDLPADVRAGWLPLDLVISTCDVLIHRAGGNTMLSAVVAGVPQLLIPAMPKQVDMCRRLTDFGASILLLGEEDTAENIAKAADELLADPSYRERTQVLSKEVGSLPTSHEVVDALTGLAG